MGLTSENIAEKYGITRKEQDELALMSNQRASAAIKDGIFKEEIVPVEVREKKEVKPFDTDEHPRETSMELLAKLPPVFKKDGAVTAGNASGITDAAAALVIMSAEKAKELGHPIGCTGARILVTLIYEMMRKNYQFGLATLCIGGGQGMATIIERK